MNSLSSLDAAFVDAEDQNLRTSLALGAVAVFDGPAPSYDEFLTAIAGRLPLMPIYRKKLRRIPFRIGPPVWVDDSNFDPSHHVRHTALPAPGGDEQLRDQMARVMAQRLDRDYPLWEYWLVEGLEGGRWAVICKAHHCMADGVTGSALWGAVFDTSPETGRPVIDAVPAADEPSDLELTARAALSAMLLPVRQGRALRQALADPGAAARQAAEMLRGVVSLAASLRPAPASSLSGHIGRQRRYIWARASLDDIKMIRRELGGTVNDVVLTAISHGFRALLLARGEEPASSMVPSLVPVSVRGNGEQNAYGNRFSAIVAELPVHVADPVERLAAVTTQMSALKASKEAKVGEAMVSLGRLAPFPLASTAVRLAFSLPQREIVTVTTNVPGPRQPLYCLGRPLVEVMPYIPIAARLRIGVSVFTYCGTVTFGITGDYDTTSDIEELAHGVEDGIAGLLKAAMQHRET